MEMTQLSTFSPWLLRAIPVSDLPLQQQLSYFSLLPLSQLHPWDLCCCEQAGLWGALRMVLPNLLGLLNFFL